MIGAISDQTEQEAKPVFHDDKLRVVVMRGDALIAMHEYQTGMRIDVKYPGDALAVECWGNLSCGNIKRNASAGHGIQCGDVGGNIGCGGSVRCKSANGNIAAGRGVHIVKD